MTQQQLFEQTYKGRKVFITGHTGFKGSWLVAWLHLLGAHTKGYALAPTTDQDLYCQINGDKLCESEIGDVRNKEQLAKALLDFQPDFVFHLAAQPLVRLSYQIPTETFDVNVMGTANVLDAVRKLEKSCSIVLITTDKVYENKEWHYPYRETDRLGGYDPYSASKAAAEIVIGSYRSSFFNLQNYAEHQKGIAVGRAGNVIGGGDWAKDRIIPDIVKALSKDEIIAVRSPNAVRPWQHVLEPLGGYLLLGAKLSVSPQQFSEAYNFGPIAEDNLTVESVVKMAIDCWGKGSYENLVLENQPHEAALLKLDISKAVNELGWNPKWNAHKAVRKTIDFYKDETATIDKVSEGILLYML